MLKDHGGCRGRGAAEQSSKMEHPHRQWNIEKAFEVVENQAAFSNITNDTPEDQADLSPQARATVRALTVLRRHRELKALRDGGHLVNLTETQMQGYSSEVVTILVRLSQLLEGDMVQHQTALMAASHASIEARCRLAVLTTYEAETSTWVRARLLTIAEEPVIDPFSGNEVLTLDDAVGLKTIVNMVLARAKAAWQTTGEAYQDAKTNLRRAQDDATKRRMVALIARNGELQQEGYVTPRLQGKSSGFEMYLQVEAPMDHPGMLDIITCPQAATSS